MCNCCNGINTGAVKTHKSSHIEITTYTQREVLQTEWHSCNFLFYCHCFSLCGFFEVLCLTFLVPVDSTCGTNAGDSSFLLIAYVSMYLTAGQHCHCRCTVMCVHMCFWRNTSWGLWSLSLFVQETVSATTEPPHCPWGPGQPAARHPQFLPSTPSKTFPAWGIHWPAGQ